MATRVAILVFDGVEELDGLGPYEVLRVEDQTVCFSHLAGLVARDEPDLEVGAGGPRHPEDLVGPQLCRLDRLPTQGFQFHAAPLGVVGMGTFPVRAYAVLSQDFRGEGIAQ